MSLSVLRRAAAVGAILGAVLLAQALPVDAATTNPTVIAVHRNGAVDVPGNSTFGTIAKMTVPAGNWSISATATVQGTAPVTIVECQLVAGGESYKSQAGPSSQGVASLQGMVLLLAHHFGKKGTVTLKCNSDGWTGDALIRDVHVTAVQVGQLTDTAGTFGTGAPRAFFAQSSAFRFYNTTANNDIQHVSLPAGTWLVQAAAFTASTSEGDRIDCTIKSSSSTADQAFQDSELFGGRRNISLEGVVTLSGSDTVALVCKDTVAGLVVYQTGISAIKVGTLKYGSIGGPATTTGSGSPTVVGGSGGPGGVSSSNTLQSIGNIALGAGNWFVTSKLSFQSGAPNPKVTCQLQVSGASDQGRVILDAGNNLLNWMALSLTRKLSASAKAVVACNQSAGTLGAGYFDLKVFALKAGTLTDTALD